MSDRSDEATTSRDLGSTDDLLEETESLLSESGGQPADQSSADSDPVDREPAAHDQADHDPEPTDDSSWLGSLRSSDGTNYFSPKSFLALVLALGAGMLAGSIVVPLIPAAGAGIGLFLIAFLLGLSTSTRRYLEVGAAGTGVGALVTLLSNPVVAFASSMRTFAALGAGLGLVICVLGYYFGRDLRDGLSRDL